MTPLRAFSFACFGALAPAFAHAVGNACWVWLPAHWPALLGGLVFGPRIGAIAAMGTIVADCAFGVGMWQIPIFTEIFAYGLLSGLLIRGRSRPIETVLSLCAAMIAGRGVYALTALVLGQPIASLWQDLVVLPLPGIALQLLFLAPLAALWRHTHRENPPSA